MNLQDIQNPKGINGSKFQRSTPGTFATGKGTTAQIKAFFEDLNCPYPTHEVAESIGKPARQLSKRMAELVAAG